MTEGTENSETVEPVEEPVAMTVPDLQPPTADANSAPAPAAPEIGPREQEGAALQPSQPEQATPVPVVPEQEQEALGAEPGPTAVEPTTAASDTEAGAPDSETTEEDDVAAAIAAAGANVAEGETFDSIAPGTVAQETGAQDQVAGGIALPVATTVSWIPFLVYDLIWLIFAGLLVWQFSELPVTEPIYNSDLYSLAVLGGVVLAAAGPLLIVAVWIGSWGEDGARKGPLLISSLIRGSIATLAGVVMWWGALLLLDQLRLGRLL